MSARPLRSLFVALLLCGSPAANGETLLPKGAGKTILQNACGGCREISRVLRAGYSAQDWRTVLHMMRNVGARFCRTTS